MITDILVETGVWLIYGFGASVYWLLKGCKTKLSDEIENHKLRNSIRSIIIFILIVVIFIKVEN
jgi:hypothetical protein